MDTGNDIKAAEQIGLAEEQLEGITGGEVEDEVEEGEEEAEEVED